MSLRLREGAGGERAQLRGGTVEVVVSTAPSEAASTVGVGVVVDMLLFFFLERELARVRAERAGKTLLFLRSGDRMHRRGGTTKEKGRPSAPGAGGELVDDGKE